MIMHINSLTAYGTVPKCQRKRAILNLFEDCRCRMTDREVMERLGYRDMNSVRPRITELIKEGALEEWGNKQDEITNRRVRVVGMRLNQTGELFS